MATGREQKLKGICGEEVGKNLHRKGKPKFADRKSVQGGSG